ncbi:MAG: lamin tail domain-containing protein [Crocinitomicaceae bacterium]|tara:strand:- start:3293 stop:3457 length:165 start_codon:yes stop_codon:yes gene_type:complete
MDFECFSQKSDLLISEYSEGSSNNKYIELFNGTGSDVDLSSYEVWKISNGGSWT